VELCFSVSGVALLEDVCSVRVRFAAGRVPPRLPLATCRALIRFAQMFLFLINMRCSATEISASIVSVWTINSLLSFLYGLVTIIAISSTYAAEALMFETLLLSSIFVNFDSSHSNFWSKYKWILSFLIVFVLVFFGSTTAAVAAAVSTHVTSNSTQSPASSNANFTQRATAVVFSNIIALSGGAYFLWTLYSESAEYGRNSIVALKAHNTSNATRISKMKHVQYSQLKLVSRAFVSSANLAAANVAINPLKFSSDHVAALKQRLCSPAHIYAACVQLTLENAIAVETALYNSNNCFVKLFSFRPSVAGKTGGRIYHLISMMSQSKLLVAPVAKLLLIWSAVLCLTVSVVYTVAITQQARIFSIFSNSSVCSLLQ
jgi:hypothetical protein